MKRIAQVVPAAIVLALAAGSAVASQNSNLHPTNLYQQQELCTHVASINAAAYQMHEHGVPTYVTVAYLTNVFSRADHGYSAAFRERLVHATELVAKHYLQTGQWRGNPTAVSLAKSSWEIAARFRKLKPGMNVYSIVYDRCVTKHPVKG